MHFLFLYLGGGIIECFTDPVDRIDIKGINYIFTYLYGPMGVLQTALKPTENCFVIYLRNSNYSSVKVTSVVHLTPSMYPNY